MNSVLSAVLLVVILPQTLSVCPAQTTLIAQEHPQYFKTPNYPGHYGIYGKRLSCSWLIEANSTYDDVIVVLNVFNSSIEPATGCLRDMAEVIDGSRSYHPPLTSWCGSSWPTQPIISSGTSVLIRFNTDFKNNNYYGFLIGYTIAKKPLFVVKYYPWTKTNYVLLWISVFLFIVISGTFFLLLFLLEGIPRLRVMLEHYLRVGALRYTNTYIESHH